MKKLSFLLFFFLFFVCAKSVFADCYSDCIKATGQDNRQNCLSDCKAAPEPAAWFEQDQVQYQNTLKDAAGIGKADGAVGSPEVNQQSWGQSMLNIVSNGLGFMSLGWLEPPKSGQANAAGGAVGFFASGIDTMVKTRPASSIEYVAYMGSQLHVPGTPDVAYAASRGGFGFTGLNPILGIWTVMRNLAYVIFAFIFIVIGVMIMTRQKIDPKTVATIQSALPKIVFALIFVTFSYPIAGFMVDLMHVTLGLIVTIINAGFPNSGISVDDILKDGLLKFALGGTWITSHSIASTVKDITDSMFLGVESSGAAKAVVSGVGGFVGYVGYGLAYVIVAIAILVALFRAWLALVGAFANIIMQVIFAPVRLTLDAIPGQNQFSAWLKDLLANLSAFPVVAIFLAIGAGIAKYNGPDAPGFAPPLLGVGNVKDVLPFVGLGILLSIPKAIDIVREVIKAPAFKYGSAWSEALQSGRNVAGAGYNRAAGYLGEEARIKRAGIEKERGQNYAAGNPGDNNVPRLQVGLGTRILSGLGGGGRS